MILDRVEKYILAADFPVSSETLSLLEEGHWLKNLEKIIVLSKSPYLGNKITLAHMLSLLAAVYDSRSRSCRSYRHLVADPQWNCDNRSLNIAGKAADVDICFVDQFTGSVMF